MNRSGNWKYIIPAKVYVPVEFTAKYVSNDVAHLSVVW